MEQLPLWYLIDAVAQLDNEVAQRMAEHRQAEHERTKRACDEGRGVEEDAWLSEWPGERADWYRATGPLRRLCLQRLRRDLEADEDAAASAEKLLAALIAAARRRQGAGIDVDMALGL